MDTALAGAGTVALALPAGTAEAVEAVALGGLLGAYAFTAYRTTDHAAAPVRELAILVNRDGRTEAEAPVRRAGVLGQELNRARDLVNTPANDLYPESFAAAVVSAGREYGLAVEVLDEEALMTGAFGGILGVGQGSARPPRLVRIAHTHPAAKASLAFVGKGITNDSGGISLKPVGANEIMKRGNRHDVTQLHTLIEAIPPVRGRRGRPRRRPDRLYADRGYDYDIHRRAVQARGITPHIARRGTGHGSGLGVHRWVVEQTIALLHWFRRLRVRWEIRDDIHEAFMTLACAIICYRRLLR